MADIKQAAKWMSEGKRVKRPAFSEKLRSELPLDNRFSSVVWDDDGIIADLSCKDLLADDWEIA